MYIICALMLFVLLPNFPRPPRALQQLHGVDSIPAPSLGLPSSITGTSPHAGAPWKCRGICKPGASPPVTRGGQFWASSVVSEGPVGPSPLTHTVTCPRMCLWWLFSLPLHLPTPYLCFLESASQKTTFGGTQRHLLHSKEDSGIS